MQIAIVAFDYCSENLRLMPWHYIHELSRNFLELDAETTIITDGFPKHPKHELIDGVPVRRVHHVRHFPPSNFVEIAQAIHEVSPDVVVWLMGLTSFFQKRLYRSIGYNIVALVSSPVYWPYEVLGRFGFSDIFKNSGILKTALAEILAPRFLIRGTFNSNSIRLIVTLSKRNKYRLMKIGINPNKLVCIRPSIDPSFLQSPSNESIEKVRSKILGNANRCFLATFLGPPLDIRGMDTLLYAAKIASRELSASCRFRLLVLSRERKEEYYAQRHRFLAFVSRLGLDEMIEYVGGFLSEDEVKVYLAASDLVILPFKHVVSDVPVSIIEGMSLGKPVLSTDLDGITELLDEERGLIIRPGDIKRLAELLVYYSKNAEELRKYGERAREYMLKHPTWKDLASKMLVAIKRCLAK